MLTIQPKTGEGSPEASLFILYKKKTPSEVRRSDIRYIIPFQITGGSTVSGTTHRRLAIDIPLGEDVRSAVHIHIVIRLCSV